MAEESIKKTPPRSWLFFAVGSSVLAGLGLATAAVLFQFMEHRTLNMEYATTHLAGLVVDALTLHYIPPQNIQASAPEKRTTEKVSLYYQEFEVNIPEQISAPGLRDLLQRKMREQLVDVQSLPAQDEPPGMLLSVAGHEFARIQFHVAPPKELPEVIDIRAAGYRIAKEVLRFLNTQQLPPANLVQGEPQEHRDPGALWVVSSMQITLPPDWTVAKLQKQLALALKEHQATVQGAGAPIETARLEILHGGKPCVQIHCTGGPAVGVTPSQQDPSEFLEIALPSYEDLPLDSVDSDDVPTPPSVEEESPPAEEEKTAPKITPPGPRSITPAQQTKTETPPVTGRVAIILDDGGYKDAAQEKALTLNPALTLSILPNTPFAADLAEAGGKAGFEIMLHMPMETMSKSVDPFPGEVTTTMDAETIRQLARKAINQIPGLRGVNNHTGSAFTSDAERMAVYLEVLKNENLFFIDSLTISTSQAFEAASKAGVPTAVRDVFLDHESDPDIIRKQFKQLMAVAKKQGYAVGIGHFRKNTLAVLEEMLDTLPRAGLQLVHASELVQ
jgi:uncharacterized protein